jgi:hypothetical protein
MNENDLRDAFAMFALLRMSFGNDGGEGIERYEKGANQCYLIADAMVKARSAEPVQEIGIVAAKTRRKKND